MHYTYYDISNEINELLQFETEIVINFISKVRDINNIKININMFQIFTQLKRYLLFINIQYLKQLLSTLIKSRIINFLFNSTKLPILCHVFKFALLYESK